MNSETSPLIKVLLALDIAGLGIDPAFAGSDPDTPASGFLIESEIAPGVTLSVEHDEASGDFVVRSDAVVDAGRRGEAMRIALQLNHVAADTDLFSVNPLSSALVFKRRLPASDQEIATIALAARAAAETGLSLARCEIPGILLEAAAEAVSEFTSDVSILRG
jgi:hypothetical protein